MKTNNTPKTQVTSGFERFLVDHGFLTSQALDKLEQAKQKTGSITVFSPGEVAALLVQEKLLEEEDVTKARAAFLNLPYIDLRQTQIEPHVLNMIPEESRNFYNMVPFEVTDKNLKVALTDPGNLQALEALEF